MNKTTPAAQNGSIRQEDSPPHTQKQEPTWQNIIKNLSANWFVIPMNSGILGVLTHQQPYQFTGLLTISTIFYVFGLVLFIVITIASIVRWTMFFRTAKRKTAGNLDEICFLGAAPIAFLTLSSLTALIVSNSDWGGYPFTLVSYVMWWVAIGWMVLTCLGAVITIFRTEVAYDRTITTTLFLPIVGLATAAVVGAVICIYAHELPPRLAVPVIIVSYLLDGIGIWVAIPVYVLYFHRLMVVGWPSGLPRISIMLLVGPAGQTGAALILLGSAATAAFPSYDKGTFLTAEATSALTTSGTLLALTLLGFDIFWIFIAFWAILEAVYNRELGYGLAWWGTIFPLATTTTTFIALSEAMDSTTFRVLAAAFTLFLATDYLINLCFTTWYIFRGNLLVKRAEPPPPVEAKTD